MSNKNLPLIDWKLIESSAPGKFIISGEYSVVYEKQAIAAAINLRTRVRITPNNDGKVRLHLKDLNDHREWPTVTLSLCRLVSKYSEYLDFNQTMVGKLKDLLHPRYQDLSFSAASTSSSATPEATKQPTTDSGPATREGADKKADDAAIAFLLLYIGLGDSYSSSARPSINVEVESSVPVGAGLGSSSAYSVALCGGLMRVFRVSAEKYIISHWAFEIDKFFHGKPSGVDNSISTNGGYILFHNGKIKVPSYEHKNRIKVLLIDTCVSRSTRELCEQVGARLREDPVRINSIFTSINEQTARIWRKINEEDFTPASIAFNLQCNQELLDALGVGHEKLQDICTRARNHHLEAKQTGAGGGGMAFVLYEETSEQRNAQKTLLEKELLEAGYKVYDRAIGCEGLVVSVTPDPERSDKYS